jgi:BirA family transcriptional regulator, biotin operon repressor / biotin---[acetyl-CoA-carboxylase] ligase
MTQVRWDVRRFATLPSTNDWLLLQARHGAPAGTVAVADHQREGRGRMGRRWDAPAGTSLLVSVLLRPLAPAGELYAATAAVALSAADACVAVAGVTPGLKWPNDLVVGDQKLAGVLAESDPGAPGGRAGSAAVVVGVGCNVNWDGPEGATSLSALAGRPVDREALLQGLLEALEPRADALDRPDGRRSVVGELRRRCVTLGRTVRVEPAGGPPVTGLAAALDDSGHLVVETGSGEVVVSAGDVVHLRPLPREPG